MDAFSRNLVLLLFGCAMLLGLGLLGIAGPDLDAGPGLTAFMEGPAPMWLAILGAVGIGAVLALVLGGAGRGSTEETPAGAGVSAAERAAPPEEEEEAPEVLADATLTLVELEILLRREEGTETPALGAAVPPPVVLKALHEARDRWMTAALAHDRPASLDEARSPFEAAAGRIAQAVPVRGRADGESASYRIAALVHVPPMVDLGEPQPAMEALGRLHGDRFIEVSMVRVPDEAETFAAPLTVAGPLAAEKLAGESADP